MWLSLAVFSSLCSAILQPVQCNAVAVDPSIAENIWSGLDTAAATSSEWTAVTVEYALSGQGYHRALKATLRSDGEYSVSNEAAYLIYINVTSDIYLDLDQISQMAEFGGPNVISSGHIDTERSAMDSLLHTVLVYITLQDKRTDVELPLHLRYLATSSSPYSVITIPMPRLLSKTTKGGISLPCSPASLTSHCHWYPSPLTSQSALVAMVPVGQSSHVTVVAIVTVTLTFSSVLYLTYIICSDF